MFCGGYYFCVFDFFPVLFGYLTVKLSCWRQGLKSPTAMISTHFTRKLKRCESQWTRLPMTLELRHRRQHWQGTFHSTKLMWQIFNSQFTSQSLTLNWTKKECNICRLLMFCLKSVSLLLHLLIICWFNNLFGVFQQFFD